MTQRGNMFTTRGVRSLHERHQLDESGQDVERLEAGDDDRQLVALDERLEDFPAGDRRGMAGGKEAFDPRVRHLGDDLHHRRDVLVRGEDGEVLRRVVER